MSTDVGTVYTMERYRNVCAAKENWRDVIRAEYCNRGNVRNYKSSKAFKKGEKWVMMCDSSSFFLMSRSA